jgi:hypothetical protein
MGQEGAELAGTPNLEFGRLDLRRVGGVGHVADDIAPAHRVLEYPVDENVDVSDRLGRQGTWPMTSAGGEQLPVQDAEMAGGEPLELDRPKGRDHAGIEKSLIGRPSRGAQVQLHDRRPLIAHEAADGAVRGLDKRAGAQGGQRIVQPGLAFPLGAISGQGQGPGGGGRVG